MTDDPKISVYFNINGNDLNFDEITHEIGIQPSKTWRQKIEHLIGHPELPNSNWSFGYEEKSYYSTDEAVNVVLGEVWAHRQKIINYLKHNPDSSASLTIAITINVDRPVYDLESGTMKKLGELGADLCFDIFDYSDNDAHGPPLL